MVKLMSVDSHRPCENWLLYSAEIGVVRGVW